MIPSFWGSSLMGHFIWTGLCQWAVLSLVLHLRGLVNFWSGRLGKEHTAHYLDDFLLTLDSVVGCLGGF